MYLYICGSHLGGDGFSKSLEDSLIGIVLAETPTMYTFQLIAGA